ncbi:hypothetical protein ACKFKG_19090 [Phormidesmis sp. 146-35]
MSVGTLQFIEKCGWKPRRSTTALQAEALTDTLELVTDPPATMET